jgi:hypothetical protein
MRAGGRGGVGMGLGRRYSRGSRLRRGLGADPTKGPKARANKPMLYNTACTPVHCLIVGTWRHATPHQHTPCLLLLHPLHPLNCQAPLCPTHNTPPVAATPHLPGTFVPHSQQSSCCCDPTHLPDTFVPHS